MPLIQLETFIHAPQQRCFDLARDIGLHAHPTSSIGEKAIAGRTSGLIALGETVTWEGKPFGIRTRLTTQIKEMRPYDYFRDEQVKGPFKTFRHEHIFEAKDGGTLMKDKMFLESPLWLLGKMADALAVKNYLRRFLLARNAVLKRTAETDDWMRVLS